MSLVAHQFGRVKFRIFVIVFFRQAQLKKIKTNIVVSHHFINIPGAVIVVAQWK